LRGRRSARGSTASISTQAPAVTAADGALLPEVARPDAGGLLRTDAMHLRARGYHRVLRVVRTLADLDGAEKVGRAHLAEALSYWALADEMRRAP
jgi:magnesium chelatase family protein